MALGVVTKAQGKQVTIILGKGKVIKAVLDEDITLNISSTFEPFLPALPFSDFITKAGNLAKGLGFGKGFSGQSKHMGFQSWKKTDPIQFTAQLGFYATHNARTQVYDPIMELCKAALPTLGAGGIFQPPGPSFIETLKDKDDKKITNKKQTVDKSKSSVNATGGSYSISIGKILRLPKIIITKAEPTFSSEVTWSGGVLYPIWGRVSLDIKTIFSAYQEMLGRQFKA